MSDNRDCTYPRLNRKVSISARGTSGGPFSGSGFVSNSQLLVNRNQAVQGKEFNDLGVVPPEEDAFDLAKTSRGTCSFKESFKLSLLNSMQLIPQDTLV